MAADQGAEFLAMYMKLLEYKLQLIRDILKNLVRFAKVSAPIVAKLVEKYKETKAAKEAAMEKGTVDLEVLSENEQKQLGIAGRGPELIDARGYEQGEAPLMLDGNMPPAILTPEERETTRVKLEQHGFASKRLLNDKSAIRGTESQLRADVENILSNADDLFETARKAGWSKEEFGALTEGLTAGTVSPAIKDKINGDMQRDIDGLNAAHRSFERNFRIYVLNREAAREDFGDSVRDRAGRNDPFRSGADDKVIDVDVLDAREYKQIEMNQAVSDIHSGSSDIDRGYTKGKDTLDSYRDRIKAERERKSMTNAGDLGVRDKQKQLSVRDHER
ncbi:hypothetical protein [Ruminococcus sp.]|uniref:hypothetical protein n=1 Tax=Ruminococcus sp. TaxID=41978 RepID=UPI0025F4F4BF|nr:hypothetical protein [Ruminococcus sp.]MBQ8967276.1 hypothetical protein [Ruminococcus sp.]